MLSPPATTNTLLLRPVPIKITAIAMYNPLSDLYGIYNNTLLKRFIKTF